MILGMKAISYAGPRAKQAVMQEHIEKAERTNPKKYRAMVQKAGENIKDCRSCHKEIGAGDTRK